MKKALCIVLALLVAFWVGSMGYSRILTELYGDEFADPKAFGFEDMTTYAWEPDLRVLSHSREEAVVYYFDQSKGQKISFTRVDGAWTFAETLAVWSATGSADDYLIWPYWKNWAF